MNLQSKIVERFPALGSHDFVLFWSGQFVSLIGTWMQSTTLPYLAYRLTGNSVDLGLIGAASSLPTLFLALPAGVWIERLDKRKIVITLQVVMMLQALALAGLTLSGLVRMEHIIALSFLLGIANAIEITARQAMLIELVGKERLPNAIALQATIFNGARVLGPSLLAPFLLFIQNNGEGWAFLANGLSYIFVIGGLLIAQTPYRSKEPLKQQNFVSDFQEGIQFIRSTRVISLLIVMASIGGLIGFPFGQQIPAVAKEMLSDASASSSDIAFRNSMLYTFQGIGALISALTLAIYSPSTKGRLMTIGQAAFILGLLAISLTRNLYVALFWMIVIGWGMVTQLATMNTLIQILVPNDLRGRVFSTYLWALQGVAPFGSLLVGWMAEHLGIANTALISSLVCLVSIGGIHLANPAIRQTRV